MVQFLGQGVSVQCLHVLQVRAWVLLVYSASHCPKTCKLEVGLIGLSNLRVGLNVIMDGCLSL